MERRLPGVPRQEGALLAQGQGRRHGGAARPERDTGSACDLRPSGRVPVDGVPTRARADEPDKRGRSTVPMPRRDVHTILASGAALPQCDAARAWTHPASPRSGRPASSSSSGWDPARSASRSRSPTRTRRRGTITLVIQAVGKTTMDLSALEVGDAITDIAGPLGSATELIEAGHAVCVGGGVGTAVVHPIAQALAARGVRVTSVIGGRAREWVIYEEELRRYGDVRVCTDDGSYGRHGLRDRRAPRPARDRRRRPRLRGRSGAHDARRVGAHPRRTRCPRSCRSTRSWSMAPACAVAAG